MLASQKQEKEAFPTRGTPMAVHDMGSDNKVSAGSFNLQATPHGVSG